MSEGTELQKTLCNHKENGWEKIGDEKKQEIYNYCQSYMNFLNNGKTEREIIKQSKYIADTNGYTDISNMNSLKPGDKVYYINRDKKHVFSCYWIRQH